MPRRPPRVQRLSHLTLATPPPRRAWRRDLGYVLVWTAIGTLIMTFIAILTS